MRIRWLLLSSCLGGLSLWSIADAKEPPSDAVRASESQRALARQRIHERAAREHRERSARIEARRRAGISLQRPVTKMPWETPTPIITQIGDSYRRHVSGRIR
jgi:hypothetical protein